MILTIDIGNTTARFCLMRSLRMLDKRDVLTDLAGDKLQKECVSALKFFRKSYPSVQEVVISSVVPKAQRIIEKELHKLQSFRWKVIGRDVIVPMENHYHRPKQVGGDRLLGAFAAKEIYGTPAIVIDFGTAITFDVVSKSGAYEGGMIIPGIRLSAEALFQKTALLPRIDKIKSPKDLIGKDTRESILSGIFYGYGVMSRGLIDLIALKMKGTPKVVVTGGYTHLMKRFIRERIDVIDQHLVSKGMVLVHQKRDLGSTRR